jgi:hypothetical protein
VAFDVINAGFGDGARERLHSTVCRGRAMDSSLPAAESLHEDFNKVSRLFGTPALWYVGRVGQSLVHSGSLSETVDAVNGAIASGAKIAADERKRVARWITSRQGQPGAYANTFAGFEQEQQRGIRLFTGERVNSASARHILGEEACRVVRQLDVRDKGVQQSLERATEGLLRCLARAAADPRNTNPGVFCCGKCTVGLWRHLAVGGLDRREERLRKGIQFLRSRRDGEGGWRTFPFWYTVLLLSELELPGAKAELRYAGPALERVAPRSAATQYTDRRRAIATRALAIT